jgi:hypothetical protein
MRRAAYLSPRALLLFLFAVSGACAGNRVPHVAPDESRPHITWEIRSRDSGSGSRFVCGSIEPSRPCVIAASASRQGTGMAVQLHLHAASTHTNYLGVMETPFVDGVKTREISQTVPRGSQPVSSLLSGRVVDTPGTYPLTISLDATQAGVDTPIRITQQVPVVVSAPATTPTSAETSRR